MGLPVQSPGGNRIGVAVIDSGVEPGPEFGDRIMAFYDFTQGGIAPPASDAYGHGTHVAGLIAGDGTQSQKRYRGLAPKARLIVLKVLDGNRQGRTSDVISAIEYATANKEPAWHRDHQPVAWPSDLRARRNRSARAGGRSRRSRRHPRRRVRRQSRAQPRDVGTGLRRNRVTRERAIRHRRGRRDDGGHQRTIVTIESRGTARADLRGKTGLPNPISSRLGTRWCRSRLNPARSI